MNAAEYLGYATNADAFADERYTHAEMLELLKMAYSEVLKYTPSCPKCHEWSGKEWWKGELGCPRCGYKEKKEV